MYYSAGTYESFAHPEKPKDVDKKSAYIIGTGLAGLRAHLRARAAMGAGPNWLLFGERNIAHDYLCQEELQGWLASGDLALLDLAFSRDQEEKIYVQDRLRESADVLRKWLADGAGDEMLDEQIQEYNSLNPDYAIEYRAASATSDDEKEFNIRDLLRCAFKKLRDANKPQPETAHETV